MASRTYPATVHTGPSATRSGSARWLDGDVFLEQDTGSLYLRVAGAWQTVRSGAGRFGDSTNYVDIATDGHLTLHGTARVWEDVRIEPSVRSTGNNVPAFAQWFTNGAGSRGVYLYTFDNALAAVQKEIFFNCQTPHAWAQTDLHVHVHWLAATTAANSKIRWGLEYNWAKPGVAFGNTTLIYADTAEGSPAPTGTTQYVHEITEFAALTPSVNQAGMSSMLICRLWRDSANAADSYTGDAGLLYIDAHLELDKLGSNAEYV